MSATCAHDVGGGGGGGSGGGGGAGSGAAFSFAGGEVLLGPQLGTAALLRGGQGACRRLQCRSSGGVGGGGGAAAAAECHVRSMLCAPVSHSPAFARQRMHCRNGPMHRRDE